VSFTTRRFRKPERDDRSRAAPQAETANTVTTKRPSRKPKRMIGVFI